MNNSDGNVPQFASAYATNRDLGFPPDEAVEYALAGLTHRKEIERIRDPVGRSRYSGLDHCGLIRRPR